MTITSSRTTITVGVVALLGLLGACGDDDAASDTTGAAVTAVAPETTVATPATSAAAPATSAATPATTSAAPEATSAGTDASTPVAGGATIATADSALGTILVDAEGNTLYAFMPDNQGPSTCSGDCAATWPALAGPATAGEGVDAALLGTAAGTEGGEQATYGGWPLYHFAADEAPGDTKGQGVGEKWFVVGADGTMIHG